MKTVLGNQLHPSEFVAHLKPVVADQISSFVALGGIAAPRDYEEDDQDKKHARAH